MPSRWAVEHSLCSGARTKQDNEGQLEEVGFRGAACSRRKENGLRVQQTCSGVLSLDFSVSVLLPLSCL